MKRNLNLIVFLPAILWFVLTLVVSRTGSASQSLETVLGYSLDLVMILTLAFIVFRVLFEQAAAKISTGAAVLIISAPAILLTLIALYLDPSGDLLGTVTTGTFLLLGGLAIAGILIGLLYLLSLLFRMIWAGSLPIGGKIDDPAFFEEMQWALEAVLYPRGFTLAREDHQCLRLANFTRDQRRVSLHWDSLDKVCRLEAYDKSGEVNNKKKDLPVFVMRCGNPGKSESFKRKAVAKLQDWLVGKGLR